MMSDFTQIGFMEAIKAYEPTQDLIRAREVSSWLKIMRIDKKKFEALVKSGRIRPRTIGSAKNSPTYYSKKEIKSAITAAKIFSLSSRIE